MKDDPQIAALFLSHQARIYGFIASLVPNRADAEDLLQETGWVIFSRAEQFRPGTNFLAWACQIAYNKVLNFRTRQSRSPLRFGDEFVAALAEYQLSAWENPVRLSLNARDDAQVNGAFNNFYQGSLDDVATWSQQLNAGQVRSLNTVLAVNGGALNDYNAARMDQLFQTWVDATPRNVSSTFGTLNWQKFTAAPGTAGASTFGGTTYRIWFDGTSGVFSSISVPEPGSLSMLAFGMLTLWLPRRRC